MIHAADALRLPSAQLSEEDIAAADALMAEIEAHVRVHMERRGCEFQTRQTNGNVIAEVNQRLKTWGYIPQWHALVERAKFSLGNPADSQTHVGFKLTLAPSDEAYRQSSAKGAN